KQRKKKAEFKLLDTKDNLDRVEDIIHEVSNQLRPLEKQAEKAKKFKSLKASLKQSEVSLLVTEIEKTHQTWQKLLSSLEDDNLKLDEMKTIVQKKENNIDN